MAMVINTNTQATYTHGIYSKNNSYMNEAMTRVATGQKINSAKDNASTWAISQRMRDRIRANDQANQNVQNDSALIRTAQGGISNTVSILTTLKERAINSANDSNLNLDREAIAAEVQQLTQQIDENATKVKFNGRYLLNGASDGTAPVVEEPTTVEEEENTDIVEPTAATRADTSAKSKIADASVYQIDFTNLRKDSSGKFTNGVGETDKLVNLLDKTGTANTDHDDDDIAFKVGDKITFSWKEDGEEQTFEYEVTAASAISDLDFTKSALQIKSVTTANTQLTFQDGSNVQTYSTDTATAMSNYQAATTGLYAIGEKGVSITDLKISVTYTDYADENKEKTRVVGQEALEFTGIKDLQPEEEATTIDASASAFMVAGFKDGSAAASTSTSLADLKIGSNYLIGDSTTAPDTTDKITFKWGDNEEDQITVSVNTTIEQLQQQLASGNKSATLNVVTAANETLKDADGNYVIKDETGQNYKTDAPTSNTADFYFVSKTGETIDASKFSITATSNDGNTDRTIASYTATAVLGIAEEEEETTDTTDDTTTENLTITPSTPLSFHVGGEQDFFIDVTIDKMTVDNLFAQKDADGNITKIYDDATFSELFKTKDGAKEAIGIIDTALNKALAEQTKLGAIESRLGYTSDNLTTMNENLEAANSAFTDSDIAKEMTNYMKYSVLSQASQYMLAQASQNAFSVLNLLQA